MPESRSDHRRKLVIFIFLPSNSVFCNSFKGVQTEYTATEPIELTCLADRSNLLRISENRTKLSECLIQAPSGCRLRVPIAEQGALTRILFGL